MRTILHVDLNNFYASVESLNHVEYSGKPLVVCGDPDLRHGIVLAKNSIAKQYGIKTGDVIWEAKQKCPDLISVKADFSLYFRYSQMARNIYEDYTDYIESYGIDECWLDVTNSIRLFGSGENIANLIRKRIKDEIGITASVGVSFNKIFAKLGSDYKKPDATTIINIDNYKEVIGPLAINDLLYVGRATLKKMNKLGISKISDCFGISQDVLVTSLGKMGEYLYKFANGLDDSPVKKNNQHSTIKSVGNSITTARDIVDKKDVEVVLNLLADSVSSRLRTYKLKGYVICIYVKTAELETWSRQTTLNYKTNNVSEILAESLKLFNMYQEPPYKLRALGIKVTKLVEVSSDMQMSLFELDNHNKINNLDKVIDNIRLRFGYESIKKGIMLLDENLTELNNPIEDNLIHPVNFF